MPRFIFPLRISEPIDASRLVTTVRRSSMDDLRSYTTSPSPSDRGVYVRSRATSPSNESQEYLNMNMAFHPEYNYTEYIPRPPSVILNPHLVTGFSSFTAMHKKEMSATATSPCAEASGALEYQAAAGPPPGYELECDDEVIVYMKDERLERLKFRSNRNSRQHSVTDQTSLSSNRDDQPHNTVSFSVTDSVRRVPHMDDLRSIYTINTSVDIPAMNDQENSASSFFDHEEHLEKILPKKKKSSVIKRIRKRFTFGSSHHRANSSDATSTKSAIAAEPSEKIKASSASLFSMRPANTHAPSIKSARPSIGSKKNVLVKSRKTNNTTPSGAPETALLTSSTRAIENKVLRRSASFSGYTDVVRPTSWELPEDLDSELVKEAMAVVAKQSAGDWVYKPRSDEAQGNGYVVGRKSGSDSS